MQPGDFVRGKGKDVPAFLYRVVEVLPTSLTVRRHGRQQTEEVKREQVEALGPGGNRP